VLTILKPSQLKADAGAILDKALKSPQYVERQGHLLVITRADVVTGIQLRPDGYFADGYTDAERAGREQKGFAATKFTPER
jgi:hypothetical protein